MEEVTELKTTERWLYTATVVLVSVMDVLLVPMNGQGFYAGLRILFSALLHKLGPRTELGLGILCDLVCIIVWIIWWRLQPIPLRRYAVNEWGLPDADNKGGWIYLLLILDHTALGVLGVVLRVIDNRRKAKTANQARFLRFDAEEETAGISQQLQGFRRREVIPPGPSNDEPPTLVISERRRA